MDQAKCNNARLIQKNVHDAADMQTQTDAETTKQSKKWQEQHTSGTQ